MNAPSHDLSSGAHPTTTFPNTHLAHTHLAHAAGTAGDPAKDTQVAESANWSPPEASVHDPVQSLREAVEGEDWANVFAEGKTQMQAQAGWSASRERCAALQCICTMSRVSRVLEIGSFCGVAALAMAETIPKNGEVVALELEPYFVEFGHKYRMRSQAGPKVVSKVGPAKESLRELAQLAKGSAWQPFDLVVIDGDKASMKDYFEFVLSSPGLLSDRAVVCLDTTPFKGQPPTRYVRFGEADHWETSSGQEDIAALRATVAAAPEFLAHEFGGLLVVQRAQQRD